MRAKYEEKKEKREKKYRKTKSLPMKKKYRPGLKIDLRR